MSIVQAPKHLYAKLNGKKIKSVPQIRSHDFWRYINFFCVCMYECRRHRHNYSLCGSENDSQTVDICTSDTLQQVFLQTAAQLISQTIN